MKAIFIHKTFLLCDKQLRPIKAGKKNLSLYVRLSRVEKKSCIKSFVCLVWEHYPRLYLLLLCPDFNFVSFGGVACSRNSCGGGEIEIRIPDCRLSFKLLMAIKPTHVNECLLYIVTLFLDNSSLMLSTHLNWC